MKYKINSPYIAYDAMEGEVVIVSLRLGFYYSIRGAGADIWEGLAKGYSESEIIKELLENYEADPNTIEKSVADMLELFNREQFLIPMPENEAAASVKPARVNNPNRKKFNPPNFEKFTDMKEVLLLDPVHDVDESGWPHQPDNP